MEQAHNPLFIDSISKSDPVWVGHRQGRPVPSGLYCGYEILPPIDGLYVNLRRTDRGEDTFDLKEGLFHLQYRSDFKEEYIGDNICQIPTVITWSKLTEDKLLEGRIKYSSNDWRYFEMDAFLQKTPPLKEAIRPAFIRLRDKISQGFNTLAERLGIRRKFDPTTARVNSSFYYGI